MTAADVGRRITWLWREVPQTFELTADFRWRLVREPELGETVSEPDIPLSRLGIVIVGASRGATASIAQSARVALTDGSPGAVALAEALAEAYDRVTVYRVSADDENLRNHPVRLLRAEDEYVILYDDDEGGAATTRLVGRVLRDLEATCRAIVALVDDEEAEAAWEARRSLVDIPIVVASDLREAGRALARGARRRS